MKKLALIIVAIACSATLAQDSGAPPALYKSSAELEAELEEAVAAAASATGWSITISPGNHHSPANGGRQQLRHHSSP